MELLSKEILGLLSICFAIAGYGPYLVMILKDRVKPHIFSWFIWGLICSIIFFAQISRNGGAGTWATGTTAVACMVLAALSLSHGEKSITKLDWVTFGCALTSIPLWLLTQHPLWSVILLCCINALATCPTLRKVWHKPYQESAYIFAVQTVKLGLSLLALRHFSLTLVLFPICDGLLNLTIISTILYRRRILSKTA